MKQDELITLWEKGHDQLFREEQNNKAMIEKYITEKTLKSSFSIKFNIIFYWFILVANLIFLSMNLAGYSSNPGIIWLLVPQVVFTIGIMIYGIDIFYKFREINNYSETIQRLINLQLRFFRGPYEWWLVLSSVAVILLQLNINLFVDNDNGTYHIYNKVMYIGISVAAFVFIYGIQKLIAQKSLRTLKFYLSDLQEGALDQTKRLEHLKKRFIWVYVVIFLLLTASLVLGILKAIG